MAPHSKKADEDFILTLSDNEEEGNLPEEEVPASPPQKKRKRAGDAPGKCYSLLDDLRRR